MDKNRIVFTLAILLAALVVVFVSARVKAEDGTVVIESVNGSAAHIIRPAHGSVSTLWTFGEKHYVYDLRAKTQTIEVSATSKEGAAFRIKLFAVYKPLESDESIKNYFSKFGSNEKPESAVAPILTVYLNNQAVKELVKYPAYDIAANLELIQSDLFEPSSRIFQEQFMTELKMLYFIDRPVFDDPKIEAAAAEAAAARKSPATSNPEKKSPAADGSEKKEQPPEIK